MNKELDELYAREAEQLTGAMARCRRVGRWCLAGELVLFGAAVAAVAVWPSWGGVAVAAVLLAAYAGVRQLDMGNSVRQGALAARRTVYERERQYLRGDFSAFADGSQYADPHHPYTLDLDIFGPFSLFHRMNRTVTTGGSDVLAAWLGAGAGATDHGEATAELAADVRWRTEFLSAGVSGPVDTAALLAMVDAVGRLSVGRWMGSRWALVVAIGVLGLFWLGVAGAVAGLVSVTVVGWWTVAQLFAVQVLTSRPLRDIARVAGRLHRQTEGYVRLLGLLECAPARSAELQGLRQSLFAPDANALDSFRRLERIMQGLDRRANVLGLVLSDVALLSDFFLVRRFLCWQRQHVSRTAQWVGAVSRADALVSMATFRYNEPSARPASVVAIPIIIYRARGLRHPFLGSAAVGNDFDVADCNFYIITGANMAGKSTFLRSLGINYVLAMNGLPVFADSLTLSRFPLFTSMRTSDDLAHGISYFNAELLRLEQLIAGLTGTATADGWGGGAGGAFIILDEILKGTNSLDKLNGSRLFLQEVSRLNVTGVVATHDLELSRLEEEQPQRFHNYCFEIELGEQVGYSYRLTPGVARNQNATFLLRRLIGKLHT